MKRYDLLKAADIVCDNILMEVLMETMQYFQRSGQCGEVKIHYSDGKAVIEMYECEHSSMGMLLGIFQAVAGSLPEHLCQQVIDLTSYHTWTESDCFVLCERMRRRIQVYTTQEKAGLEKWCKPVHTQVCLDRGWSHIVDELDYETSLIPCIPPLTYIPQTGMCHISSQSRYYKMFQRTKVNWEGIPLS